MFIRSTVVKGKDGKTYRYWKLVENYRTERGARQRVVAHLGDLSNFTAEDWQALADRMGRPEMARALEARVQQPKRGRPRQVDLDLHAPPQANSVAIRLSSVHWTDARDFGDVYVALELWKRLGLGSLLAKLLDGSGEKPSPQGGRPQEVPISLIAALIVVNRLVAPRSEWAICRWWPRTALPSLLGIPVAKVTDYRLYHGLDAVWAHKEAIEAHLAREGERLFGRDYSFLIYDLTSTYFEGQARTNPKAQRGYSRDHRADAKQVCIGLVVDREGFPIGMETWRGNIKDHQTLSATLDKLEARFGRGDEEGQPLPLVCMDRGIAAEDNVRELRRRRYRYVLATRRGEARKHWDKINPEGWQVLRQDREGRPLVEVQEAGREGRDRLILVRSAGAREKERGIHDRFLGRLKGDLERLAKNVATGWIKDPEKIQRQVGRLQERYPGVSRWVEVELLQGGGGRRLVWSVKPEAEEEARAFEGIYLLRTNVQGTSTREVWEQYSQLTRVESAFRALKHDLDLRPVFHHKEDRVDAHIFFSFLAYVLLWALEHLHRAKGGQLTGRRLLEVLHEIKLGTIAMTTTEGQPLRLERIQRPTREQAEILASLHITLPKPRTRLEAITLHPREPRTRANRGDNF